MAFQVKKRLYLMMDWNGNRMREESKRMAIIILGKLVISSNSNTNHSLYVTKSFKVKVILGGIKT